MNRRDFLGVGAGAMCVVAAVTRLSAPASTPLQTRGALLVPWTGSPIEFIATSEERGQFWLYVAHSWLDLLEQLFDPTRWVGNQVRIHATLERYGRGSLVNAVMLHHDVALVKPWLGPGQPFPVGEPLVRSISEGPSRPARGWPLWDSAHRAIWPDYHRHRQAMYVADREHFLKYYREDQLPTCHA